MTAVYAAVLAALGSGLAGYVAGSQRTMTRVRRAVRAAGAYLAPRLAGPAEADAVSAFLERVEVELQ